MFSPLVWPSTEAVCSPGPRELKTTINKKVLLRERKRHSARGVVSTPFVVLTGYPPSWGGGGGNPAGRYPTWVRPHPGPGKGEGGNVLTHVCPSVCPQGGGYPYPIMLCNISQNAMGQTLGGGGGYPYPIMLCNITQNAMGHTPGGYPARSGQGGGYPGVGGHK